MEQSLTHAICSRVTLRTQQRIYSISRRLGWTVSRVIRESILRGIDALEEMAADQG